MQKIEMSELNETTLDALKTGDCILLSGVIYTARDAAHQRLYEMIQKNEELPLPLKNQAIYYTGPTPAPKGKPIGSCGPTTSARMDKYTPALLDLGVKLLIGKGGRSEQVKEALIRNKAVYLAAAGGAGAYLANCVLECTPVAFLDLQSEAIYRLVVKDMPLTVVMDIHGRDLYKLGRDQYKNK